MASLKIADVKKGLSSQDDNRLKEIGSGRLQTAVCKITEVIDKNSAYAEIKAIDTSSEIDKGEIIKLYGKRLNLVVTNTESFENYSEINEEQMVKVYYDKLKKENGEIILYVHGSPYLQEL